MSISPTELSDKAGISLSFASMLLSGNRGCSLAKALQIYDATGQQFGVLKGLSIEAIDELRRQAA